MKDWMREMSKWWDEVLREAEEDEADSGSEDDKNCAPKASFSM